MVNVEDGDPPLDLVTFGEAMTLLVAEAESRLRHAGRFARSIAGAESNVAIGLSRLGRRTAWIGRVGDDPFGHALLDTLRAERVGLSRAIIDDRAPTGLLIRDRAANRIEVLYYRAASAGSRLQPEDIDQDLIRTARLLHVTGITPALSDESRRATGYAVEVARDHEVPVSFDPNLRAKLWQGRRPADIMAGYAGSDIILAGLGEAERLSGRTGRRPAAAWFLEHGAKLVVIKQGSEGAWATDGERVWQAPAIETRCIDPVGAGDAFAAGFLHGWLEGEDPQRCLALGNAVAALKIQLPGDMDGLPYRHELDDFLTGTEDVAR